MKPPRLFGGAEYFLPELFAGFNVGLFLPFPELAVQILIFKSGAFFFVPLGARAGISPAVVPEIKKAAIAPADRLLSRFHD
jgi:hypothetical protein